MIAHKQIPRQEKTQNHKIRQSQRQERPKAKRRYNDPCKSQDKIDNHKTSQPQDKTRQDKAK